MSVKGHATGMAGEFAVMEKLFRLSHEPALTLGNAKTVDIFTKSPTGNIYQVSVKSLRGGGKWGVGKQDFFGRTNLIFVFLLYRDFEKLSTHPEAWVMPACDVQRLKRPWLGGSHAIYCSNKRDIAELEKYRDAWKDYLK